MTNHACHRLLLMVVGLLSLSASRVSAQPPDQAAPPLLADRGTGVPSSMFGTFIRKGELIIYPFFEKYRDEDYEYAPEELGATGDVDYRGRYRASEWLLLFGYGLTDDLAVEFEMAQSMPRSTRRPATCRRSPRGSKNPDWGTSKHRFDGGGNAKQPGGLSGSVTARSSSPITPTRSSSDRQVGSSRQAPASRGASRGGR